MTTHASRRSLFDSKIVRRASVDALAKLSPRAMMKNPVMFVVEIGSVLTSIMLITNAVTHRGHLQLQPPDNVVALVYGAFCEFCGSDG